MDLAAVTLIFEKSSGKLGVFGFIQEKQFRNKYYYHHIFLYLVYFNEVR